VKTRSPRFALLALGFAACAHTGSAIRPLAPQPQYASAVEAHIAKFENSFQQSDSPRMTTLDDEANRLHVPGLSVAVFERGELSWARGYGLADVETGEAVTPDTRFQAASISKVVTTLAALRLVEQGKLSLDADVNGSLKSWKVPSNHGWPPVVTLRELLAHTAGTNVHGFGGYRPDQSVPTLTQVLDGRVPANSPAIRVETLPGAEWRYSGGGFEIVQQLIIDVTGQTFPEAMDALVLRPAGMTASGFSQPPSDRGPLASGHDEKGSRIPGRYHLYPEMAAAGLWTTPSDLGRVCLVLGAARAGRAGALLSPALVEEMLTFQSNESYGLGIGLGALSTDMVVSHNGANAGFGARLLCEPDLGNGVVAMSNRDFSSIVDEAAMSAVAAQQWLSREPASPAAERAHRAQEAVGHYRVQPRGAYAPRWMELEIGSSGAGLTLRPTGQQALTLDEVGVDSFVARQVKNLGVRLRRAPVSATSVDPGAVVGVWLMAGSREDYYVKDAVR
jgi:CubicO group peptidase (beta-lactamase class C family)